MVLRHYARLYGSGTDAGWVRLYDAAASAAIASGAKNLLKLGGMRSDIPGFPLCDPLSQITVSHIRFFCSPRALRQRLHARGPASGEEEAFDFRGLLTLHQPSFYIHFLDAAVFCFCVAGWRASVPVYAQVLWSLQSAPELRKESNSTDLLIQVWLLNLLQPAQTTCLNDL